MGFGLLELRTPRPPSRHVTWKSVKFKIGHEGFNPAGTRPEYLNKSEAPDDVAADLFAREVRSGHPACAP